MKGYKYFRKALYIKIRLEWPEKNDLWEFLVSNQLGEI